MHVKMPRIRRSMFLVSAIGVVALFGAACAEDTNGDNGTDPLDPTTTLPTMSPTTDPTTAPTETGTPGGDEPITLGGTIEAVGDSGASGTVTLTDADGETEVTVTISGMDEGTYANHIHAGSCAVPGDVVHPLDAVEVGADGSATVTTTVSATVEELAAGYYYTVHVGGEDDPGEAAGCADFEIQ